MVQEIKNNEEWHLAGSSGLPLGLWCLDEVGPLAFSVIVASQVVLPDLVNKKHDIILSLSSFPLKTFMRYKTAILCMKGEFLLPHVALCLLA